MTALDHCLTLRTKTERRLNPHANALPLILVIVIAVPTVIWDCRELRVPDWLTVTVFLAGGVQWIVLRPGPWWEFSVAAGAGLIVPLIARCSTRGGLGWGDIKLSTGLGLYVGWPGVLHSIGAAAILGLAGYVAQRRPRNESGMPFGPFLIGGAVIVLAERFLRQGGA